MVSIITNIGAETAVRYLNANNASAQLYTQQLASGSAIANPVYSPSSAAIAAQESATIASLQQASINMQQAGAMINTGTGYLQSTLDVLTRMQALTVAANNGSMQPAELQMLNQEYQALLTQVGINATDARWGGVSLFGGGVGTATAVPAQSAANVGALAAPTNTINNTNMNTVGFVSGAVSAVCVISNAGDYQVTLTVGGQIFQATTKPNINTNFTLASLSDPYNSITFGYSTSIAGITNAATFANAFEAIFGLNVGATTGFTPVAVAAPGTITGPTAGAATTPGVWAVTYDNGGGTAGATGTFYLTNGTELYTATITTAATVSGTVTFSNGFSFTLTSFVGTSNINAANQFLYDVAEGTGVTVNFQYGTNSSTDVLTVTFDPMSIAALGLSGTSVLSASDAQTAGTDIADAISLVSNAVATLGAQARQLEYMGSTISLSIQNNEAARSAFADTDVAETMVSLVTARSLEQLSGSVLSKALNDQTQLAQLIATVS